METFTLSNVTSFLSNNTNSESNRRNGAVLSSSEFSSDRPAADFHKDQKEPEGLVSDEDLDIFIILNNASLTGIISVVGCVFNVINIVIFYRLGFKDTVNITLMSLAVADVGALIPLIWKALLFNPYFNDWDKITFDYQDVQHFTAGLPHFCFARISSLITAFVTFERCLCIAMPLKVRVIITPRRTVIIVIFIFFLVISTITPLFCFLNSEPKFYPKQNKTLFGIVLPEDGLFVMSVAIPVNIFFQIFSVVAVIICTIVLLVQLKQKSSWRTKAIRNRTNNVSSISNNYLPVRDMKVMKVVLFISIIFIICFLPSVSNLIAMLIVDEYCHGCRYNNAFGLTWSVVSIFESTNSMVNIFVYIRMSSKYAAVFNEISASWKSFFSQSWKKAKLKVHKPSQN